MKRILMYILIVFVSFLLQTTVFRTIGAYLSDIVPNLLFLLVASFALLRGERTGLVLGFFSGLMTDLVFGSYLGFYTLLFMFFGFMIGILFYQSVEPDHFLPVWVVIACGDLVFGFVEYVLLFLLRTRFHFRFYLMHVIVPEAIYTLAIAVFLYPFYLFLDELLQADENRRAKKFV
ncbi:MAG: rod shape-determining protein MreD [Lachnospiraceae bacterium]|nr:rod shape-determining protein MreD [Lachnospiraceae bacterium]